jgi:membrane fusion protein, multidrug efflux system
MSTSASSPQDRHDGPQAAVAVPTTLHSHRWKRWAICFAILAVLAAAVVISIPSIKTALNTVSTDDAYVNGHTTYVAPRVAGQVERVLVDDNMRVNAARFKLGDEAISKLRIANVPETILSKLSPLKDKEFAQEGFVREIAGVLDFDEMDRWKSLIMNDAVNTNALLVELDPKPYQIQVNIKLAALIAAKADLRAAESEVRGTLAQLRSQRWKLQTSMEQVDNQVALLKARVAAIRSREATLVLAKQDLERAKTQFDKGVASKQVYDAAVEAVAVADAQAKQAEEETRQVRVSLGLPPTSPNGDLTSVPEDLNQTFSTVRQAVADLIRIAAQVGLPLSKSEATPKQVLDEFRSRDANRDVDRIFATLIPEAPAVKQAEAKVLQAQRDLDQAVLNLEYCKVFAEIDGVVTRRNVNRGNNVQAGQQLMAVRSLKEIWIDANFKETQLADLRIGQHVDIYADTYGNRSFSGHITGFTYGTGSTLALLPPQNATGNFVKVVQRLPVRIELDDYDPEGDTLFAGLSVTPYVDLKRAPTGPNAGHRLQGGSPP